MSYPPGQNGTIDNKEDNKDDNKDELSFFPTVKKERARLDEDQEVILTRAGERAFCTFSAPHTCFRSFAKGVLAAPSAKARKSLFGALQVCELTLSKIHS